MKFFMWVQSGQGKKCLNFEKDLDHILVTTTTKIQILKAFIFNEYGFLVDILHKLKFLLSNNLDKLISGEILY